MFLVLSKQFSVGGRQSAVVIWQSSVFRKLSVGFFFGIRTDF